MTDTQTIAAAILTGLTTIAAAIRWSSGRLAKSQDRGINALIKNAESHATLTAKFDALMARFETLATRFDGIVNTLLGLGDASLRDARDANIRDARDPKMNDSQKTKIPKDNGRTTRPISRQVPRADTGSE